MSRAPSLISVADKIKTFSLRYLMADGRAVTVDKMRPVRINYTQTSRCSLALSMLKWCRKTSDRHW